MHYHPSCALSLFDELCQLMITQQTRHVMATLLQCCHLVAIKWQHCSNIATKCLVDLEDMSEKQLTEPTDENAQLDGIDLSIHGSHHQTFIHTFLDVHSHRATQHQEETTTNKYNVKLGQREKKLN